MRTKLVIFKGSIILLLRKKCNSLLGISEQTLLCTETLHHRMQDLVPKSLMLECR